MIQRVKQTRWQRLKNNVLSKQERLMLAICIIGLLILLFLALRDNV